MGGVIGRANADGASNLGGKLAGAAKDAGAAAGGAIKGAVKAGSSAAVSLVDKLSNYAGGPSSKMKKPNLISPKLKANSILAGQMGPSLAVKGIGGTNAKNLIAGKAVDSLTKLKIQSHMKG
jgi:hypothetical protein